MKTQRMLGIPVPLVGLCLTLTVLLALVEDAKAQIPSPLLYFNFEEGSGNTLNDTSGNDLHGTIDRGVTFVEGVPDGPTPGGGGLFNNGLVQVSGLDAPSQLAHRDSNPDGSYTLAAWMKPDAGSIGGDHFFWGQTNQGIHNGLRGSGTLHTAHWGSDFNANTILTADEWLHAVWTYDGPSDSANLYLNGVLDGGPFSQLGPNGSGNLILGGRNGGSENFNGCVDDVAVWDEVLSEAIITQLANGAHPNEANLTDTDGDGLPDIYEDANGLDKNDPADAESDSDANGGPDGLTALQEFERGTDPQDADSDDDGLLDGVETNTGTFTSASDTGTDPNHPDTDGDGLSDKVETNTGNFVDANDTGTNPHAADTDGDRASDWFEIQEGFDPTDPDSTPGVVIIQPSFIPINNVGAASGYEPNLDKPGLDYQENHYAGGVIFNNDAQNNYDVHTSGDPAPLRSFTSPDPVPYFDHGGGGNAISSNNLPFLDGAGENFTVRVNGYIDFRTAVPGTYTIHLGADDTNLFVMDTPDGVFTSQHNCCPQNHVMSFELIQPGFYPFDNVFGEQGGGDWGDLGISGGDIPGIVALGDTDAGSPPVYSIMFDDSDSDGDGIPDLYEISFDAIDTLDQLTADGDFDNDGINDPDEFAAGTNPTEADTDGDGVGDGDEIANGTNPLDADSDGDGLSDGEEATRGTDPLNPDTDGDGAPDGKEVEDGRNPLVQDSPPIPAPYLYYTFEEGGGDSLIDSSGNDFTGTIERGVNFVEGAPNGPSPGGGAEFLNGLVQVTGIDAPSQLSHRDSNPDGSYTLACWMKPFADSIGGDHFFWGQTSQGIHNGLRGSGTLHTAHWGSDFNASTVLTADEWVHAAWTYDGPTNTALLFLDGVQDGGPFIQLGPNGSGNLILGGRNGGSQNFNGCIDEVLVWQEVLDPSNIAALAGGASPFGSPSFFFDVVANGPDQLDLIWESQGGLIYNVRSETDPSTGEPGMWPIYGGNQEIGATPPFNTLTIDRPGDPFRLFVVESGPAPPEVILGDDFESGQGEWTTGSDGAGGTAWELGEPTAGPGVANSPVNAFATNLDGDYELDADVWLRSPPIDLTTAGGATLWFFEFVDIEEGFDAGSIRVLDAADNSELAVIDDVVDGVSVEWEQVKKSIPAEALGKVVVIEFRFASDDIQNFWGWGIDDFQVTVP